MSVEFKMIVFLKYKGVENDNENNLEEKIEKFNSRDKSLERYD